MPTGKGREDRGAAGGARPGMPPSSAILDTAFRSAYRTTPHGETRLERSRRRALLKIVRSSATVSRHLRLAVKLATNPALSEFDRALIDRRLGAGRLARAERRVQRAVERIRGLSAEEQRLLRKESTSTEFAESVRRFYGRLASFTREVDPDLKFLGEVARFRRDHPSLDPEQPVLAVAGFPNVGKSSLVGRLSSASPKVAAYPFTTVALEVGHADLGFDRLQVLDTPGVLNRGRAMNPSEVEADAAVSRAATVLLFVLDPTGSSGYTMAEQEKLLHRWRTEIPGLSIIEVETKADVGHGSGRRLAVSATTGEGIEALQGEIQRVLSKTRRRPEPAVERGSDGPEGDTEGPPD